MMAPPAAGTEGRERYWLTRFLFLRLLGLIYAVAFLVLVNQGRPLIGADGLLPARQYLDRIAQEFEDPQSAFLALPTLFWMNASDRFMVGVAYAGLAGSVVVLAGFANVPLLALLWFTYLSFCHIGQLFWGYGWESLLLETGFLAIFMVPTLSLNPFPGRVPPPKPLIWLVRWVLFRVMLGAGLIKIRGDSCWRDLTCMMYHYQTQPLPNPLSWYLHHLPGAFHRFEVLFNHFVELIVPWTLFAPRGVRHVGGLFLVAFQLLLIASGNLSWLNWLTLTLCVACFDDAALARLFPTRLRARLATYADVPSGSRRVVSYGLTALVAYLSVYPVLNMLSPRQAMNASFDPWQIVNTYGAFGSVGRTRPEVIIEGTNDDPTDPAARWVEYEFKCKPGSVARRPCVIAPYQYRIDWQIWFAAMSDYLHNPWLVHFVYQLLRGEPRARGMLANDPFPTGPKYIRAELYEYEFTPWGDSSGNWWVRRRVDEYLPPLSRDNPELLNFLRHFGWLSGTEARR